MRKVRPSVAPIGPNIAKIAALIGDPARARILFSLLDDRECAASELASRADTSPQSASGHLRQLVDGGLLVARRAGRRRYFRLSSSHVARAIEALGAIAPVAPIVSLSQQTTMQRLREARSCYDHLAGRLGVAITEACVDKGAIDVRDDAFFLTRKGGRFLQRLGIDVEPLRGERRCFIRACMDWTERRSHLAGGVGAALLEHVLAEEWLVRSPGDRALRVTPAGRIALTRIFGVRFDTRGGQPRVG